MAMSRKAEIQRWRGFTLVELLVVIAIIGLLIGILMPVVTKVKAEGQKAVTRGYIQDLSKACGAYKVDTGEYPEDSISATFFYYLQEKGMNCPYVDKQKFRTSGSGTSLAVRDPWGNNPRYFRAPVIGKSVPGRFYQTTSELKAALDNFRGNKNSYNLWSCGPDGVDDSSAEATGDFSGNGCGGDAAVDDDIVNWQ